MKTAEPIFRKEVSTRDTRCRSCWARIRPGRSIVVDGHGAVFHAECPPKFLAYPDFARLRDDGVVPESLTERDEYYVNTKRR